MAKAKLGSGKRFAALSNKLAARPGVTNPDALAAYIGRKKFGAKKMASMAAKGRKHHSPSMMDAFVAQRRKAGTKGY